MQWSVIVDVLILYLLIYCLNTQEINEKMLPLLVTTLLHFFKEL